MYNDDPGLYYKLHGTHRPNSMKKTVIKRRKRVPAAGPPVHSLMSSQGQSQGRGQNRMTDQAAAEALVSVGRGGQERSTGEESTEDEQDQRARKKSRRGAGERLSDLEMDIDDVQRQREKRRDQAWGDDPQSQGPSTFSSFPVESQAGRTTNFEGASGDSRYGPQRGFSAAHGPGSGGYELPPLTAALGGDKASSRYPYSGGGAGSSPYVSEGGAPSRTHSPGSHHTIGPGGSSAVQGSSAPTYHLPPPHSLSQSHSHSQGPFYQGSAASQNRHVSPRPQSPLREGGNSGGVPSLSELRRHYSELSEQRRRMQEMLDKTDRMMAGVKRGIEEMQQLSRSGNGSNNSSSNAPSVPLSSRSERREGSNIWPIAPSDSTKRD